VVQATVSRQATQRKVFLRCHRTNRKRSSVRRPSCRGRLSRMQRPRARKRNECSACQHRAKWKPCRERVA